MIKKTAIGAVIAIAAYQGYKYFTKPKGTPATSSADGKKKDKDVASPKLKRYPPMQWNWVNNRWIWSNWQGKLID